MFCSALARSSSPSASAILLLSCATVWAASRSDSANAHAVWAFLEPGRGHGDKEHRDLLHVLALPGPVSVSAFVELRQDVREFLRA